MNVKVFPSFDVPHAEASFRAWMTSLTGLEGDDLECWLEEQAKHVIGRQRFDDVNISPPELANLRLMAQGMTAQMVGRARNVSWQTVKSQIKQAMHRNGCHSVTELVVLALAAGLLLEDDNEMRVAA